MYLDYTKNEEYFSTEELRHLAGAMGFPKTLFEDNLPTDLLKEKGGVLIRDLMKCIDERCFHVDLHFTLNLKSAIYNTACLKQAIMFISRRFLSFRQLQEVRLAFESYENYDQKGMKIDEYVFLRTLKMCGRVISPKKLMHKIKHLKKSYKEPGRIQFFEFLNLLAICELTKDQYVPDSLHSPVEKSWTKLYKIDNFKHFTIPKDKKLWKHLNKEYKEKELNYNRPELKSSNFVKTPLSTDDFRMQVKLSNKQYDSLHRSLRNSSKQVKLAKGGFTFVRPPTTHTNKLSLSRRAMSASSKNTSHGRTPKVSARVETTTNDVFTHDAINSPLIRPKRRQRPQSSPPVLSDSLEKDLKSKVENVKFDICTENRRWSEYYQSNMNSLLPNYHEVLKRMRKPSTAPKRKRYYRKERPSRVIINKLSNPEANPPPEHMEHCDALTRGNGADQHSILLKNKAKKIRCKSAPVMTSYKATERPKSQTEYSSLLRTLMQEYGYISDDYSSTSSDEDDIKRCETVLEGTVTIDNSPRLSETVNQRSTKLEQIKEDELESESESTVTVATNNHINTTSTVLSESDAEQKKKFLEEYFKPGNKRKSSIHKLLVDSKYSQTFLKPDKDKSLLSRICISPSHTHKEIEYTPSTSEIKTSELSDFERHILEPENLRIPHDVCLVEDRSDYYEMKRKRRSLMRIAQRYVGTDKDWFKSSLVLNCSLQSPTMY